MGIFDKPNVFADKPSVFADKPSAIPMPEEQPRPTPMRDIPAGATVPYPAESDMVPNGVTGPTYGPQGGMAPPGIGPVNRQEMKMRTPNGGMPEPAHKTRFDYEAMPSRGPVPSRGPMSRPGASSGPSDIEHETGMAMPGPRVTPMASPGPRYALDNRDDVEFDEG